LEIGRARKELNEALMPGQHRARRRARQQIADTHHNAAVLKSGNAEEAKRIEAERAISDDRREAIRDVNLDDLMTPNNENGEIP